MYRGIYFMANELNNNANIVNLIHKGGIYIDVEGSTPEEIYTNICRQIDLPEGMTAEQVSTALIAREKVLSTAVGNGIALPHARSPIMKSDEDAKIVVAYLKKPINMNAPDEKDVFVMFILLTSNQQVHLKVLTSLAGLFRSVRFRKALEDKAGEAELDTLIMELDK